MLKQLIFYVLLLLLISNFINCNSIHQQQHIKINSGGSVEFTEQDELATSTSTTIKNNVINNIFKKSRDHNEQQDVEITTAYSLIERILGEQYLTSFEFNLQIQSDHQEYFQLQSNNTSGKISITANSGVNMAQGLYYYLKYYCFCSFTWTGDQCQFNHKTHPTSDNPLPTVPQMVQIEIPSLYRYYMNVCTFGYTTVWWNWTQWEREIDWMALNGYNLPLAFNGQEYIWYQVFSELGLSQDEIFDWLSGPAFLPWNRMGNINNWGGPITMEWMAQQRDLQIQILQRMRSYGMQAVLPGFAGHVPQSLATLYPQANITVLGSWCNFTGTSFLESSDPLYVKITNLFISTQNKVYGTDHFYNFDPFNELDPPSNQTDYLRNTSVSMFNNLIQADPDAIWVLQGWFLVNDQEFWQPNQTEAFLSGIPMGNLIVLDLWADVIPGWNLTNFFYGHYWVWCMLHNFGGRTGMYGRLPFISTSPIEARSMCSNMVGTGLTPEAIDQNVIVYDLMSEMSWRSTPPNLTQWVVDYTHRRYGKLEPHLVDLWLSLSTTVFNCSANETEGNMGAPFSLVAQRPQMIFGDNLFYPMDVLVDAWYQYFLVNDSYIVQTDSFNFDVTEITIQALSNYFLTEYMNLQVAFNQSNLNEFEQISERMLNIIDYMEMIAASQQINLVGLWTLNARQWSPSNYSNLEFNARNQLTLWGPQDSVLHDYAYKLWSGLIGDFYYTRWMIFFKYTITCIQDSMTFNATYVDETVAFFEQTWNEDLNIYPYYPTGSSIKISKFIQTQVNIPTNSSSASE
ncbi:alpha-N-acetylglucosaminidase [Tieghemostelium lacteum]|uniref:Alpha-N-acetylglucosaminidase n=1 Tax=Tieghemostelium lacteum TaxID=361077 RepID=A0A152A5G6_TIELA|nr:alpha-N-acetylglucosaminidase [Tieghemostelium lacteum]|eukprot:KYR01341.1 alpha-N-acetylglucosaminidase [Tieghemostelium lacteum]